MTQRRYKRPYRVKRRKSFLLKAPFWFSALVFCSFIAGISFACFSPWIQVSQIKVAGTQKVEKNEFTNALGALTQKQLAILQTKSILLFNLQTAKEQLLKQFPQISDIKITRQFPSTIYASVLERAPAAAIKASDNAWHIVDSAGVVFENSTSSNDLFEISSENFSQKVGLGQTAIAKDLLQQIMRVKASIEYDTNIQLAGALIKNTQRVDLITKEGWQIYINPQKDLDWQTAKLKAVASDPMFASQRKNLSYVDLRFTKVYVKQK